MVKHLFFLTVILSMLSACDTTIDAPDVSHISNDIEIIRYDKAIALLDTGELTKSIQDLNKKHPSFSDLYFSKIMPFLLDDGSLNDTLIKGFLRDERINSLLDTIQIVFGAFDKQKKEFAQAAQYFRYYFPEAQIANFYTLISEFGYQNFIFNDNQKDGIGIGLDMFLGQDYNYKSIDPTNPSFSDYMTRTYNEDHIVKKSFELMIDDIIGPANGKRMLDKMIQEGKKAYILGKILPFKHDTIIMEYSKEQLDWAYNNEKEMWAFFLDKKLLYETSLIKIGKFINPAPNSHGMPEESPGRSAIFIGRQIVRKYMERFPETSLEELIQEFDSQKILEKSKYKPKRK